MEPADLMQALMDLAREAELEIRLAGTGDGGAPELQTASGICRVRDATWVVLSQSDSVEVQLDVLADALRTHAAELLEERYLPPAVRQRLFAPEPSAG